MRPDGIVVVEEPEEHRLDASQHRMRDVERLESKERLEDRVRHIEPDEGVLGQHQLHLPHQVLPLGGAVEVVEDDEAAFEEIGAQVRGSDSSVVQ
jgi:hypothetical protein